MNKKKKRTVGVCDLHEAIENAFKEYPEISVYLNGHRAIPDRWITIEHQSFWRIQLFQWVFNLPVGKQLLLKIAESLQMPDQFVIEIYSNDIPLELRKLILAKLENIEAKLKIRIVSPSKKSFSFV
ncbi:hypothetical protein HYV31_02405 [candidate division WWE3 bacterium]|nr:hypothetical protein [candidate division WWE3 bacterium]